VPGGPYPGQEAAAAVTAALERRYHFDEPLWKQYTNFLWNGVQGDLGFACGDREVTDIIRNQFFVTAQLGARFYHGASARPVASGTLSALNHNGPLD
jgi:oligopeptide transport system permease protein